MTRFSLEFTLTLADWGRFISDRSPRWMLISKRAIAALILSFGLVHFVTNGPGWELVVLFVVALWLVFPHFIFRLSMYPLLALCRPRVRVIIDDDMVTVWGNKQKKDIPWSSFVMFGSAKEFANHFWLECGRGSVFIPKRAFATDAELAGFRAFVSGKMGERCKFNAVHH